MRLADLQDFIFDKWRTITEMEMQRGFFLYALRKKTRAAMGMMEKHGRWDAHSIRVFVFDTWRTITEMEMKEREFEYDLREKDTRHKEISHQLKRAAMGMMEKHLIFKAVLMSFCIVHEWRTITVMEMKEREFEYALLEKDTRHKEISHQLKRAAMGMMEKHLIFKAVLMSFCIVHEWRTITVMEMKEREFEYALLEKDTRHKEISHQLQRAAMGMMKKHGYLKALLMFICVFDKWSRIIEMEKKREGI